MQRLGRYTIESELGRGAFGRVYRAFDPNLKLAVAIKVLISDGDPELLSRFQTEARTNAGLLHKNIVTLYDFSEQENPPYLVMELLEGQSLQELIGKPMGLLEKVDIMYQVAEGLQHAHANDVVHRDMKPGNIMVLHDGTAKILDFGIAQLLDQDGTRRQGDVTGTIPYLAPEQFRGEAGDKLADIWAFGVIYYELLTGTQPFYANDAGTVMYRVTTYEPPPLRQILPDAPEALEELMQRLMSKERELRVDKMEDVILDTQPILQQLRQARAAAIAHEVRPLVEAGDFEGSKDRIDQILKMDPRNVEARQWREQRQLQIQRDALRARADALVRQANQNLAVRRFQDAIACFQAALKLDKNRPDISVLLEDATTALEKTRRAARLVAEAREAIPEGQIASALEKAARAVSLDSNNREAAELVDELGHQLRDHQTAESAVAQESRKLDLEREHREYLMGRDRILVEAMILLENRRPREAADLLEDALGRYQGEPEFSRLLVLARQGVKLREREAAERLAEPAAIHKPHAHKRDFWPPKQVLLAAAAMLGVGVIITLLWLDLVKSP